MDANGKPRISRQLLSRLMSNQANNTGSGQTYGATRAASANRTHNVDRRFIKGYGDSMSANSSIGSSQRVGGSDASSGSDTAMPGQNRQLNRVQPGSSQQSSTGSQQSSTGSRQPGNSANAKGRIVFKEPPIRYNPFG